MLSNGLVLPQATHRDSPAGQTQFLNCRLQVSPTAKKPVPPILLDAAAKPSSSPLEPSLSGRLRSLSLARTKSGKAVRQGNAEEEDPFGGGRANSNTSPWGRRLLSSYAGDPPTPLHGLAIAMLSNRASHILSGVAGCCVLGRLACDTSGEV